MNFNPKKTNIIQRNKHLKEEVDQKKLKNQTLILKNKYKKFNNTYNNSSLLFHLLDIILIISRMKMCLNFFKHNLRAFVFLLIN